MLHIFWGGINGVARAEIEHQQKHPTAGRAKLLFDFLINRQPHLFVKSMDSPGRHGVVQPCPAVVHDIFERAVNMLGSGADEESGECLADQDSKPRYERSNA